MKSLKNEKKENLPFLSNADLPANFVREEIYTQLPENQPFTA